MLTNGEIEELREAVTGVVADAGILRRRLHQMPEESFQEHRTAELLTSRLRDAGLAVNSGIAGTGLSVRIEGALPGPTVALRADMDGLRLQDRSGCAHHSEHPGFSHGCGHDGHMACLWAAAVVLSKLRSWLHGNVLCLFQPGEEMGCGAQAVLKAGGLGDPMPQVIFALHCWPGLACGHVAARPGPMTSVNEMVTIRFTGQGGHAARPLQARSPILCAARVAGTITSLTCDTGPIDYRRAVGIGVFQGGSQANVIPDDTMIQGTVRAFTKLSHERLKEQIRHVVSSVCSEDEVEASVSFERICPGVDNDPGLYQVFTETAEALLGAGRCEYLEDPSMGSEDFGYYTEEVPGLLFRLGMGQAGPSLHSSTFDFDDAALESGALLLAGLAIRAGTREEK